MRLSPVPIRISFYQDPSYSGKAKKVKRPALCKFSSLVPFQTLMAVQAVAAKGRANRGMSGIRPPRTVHVGAELQYRLITAQCHGRP
jgi:hypothetical protein